MEAGFENGYVDPNMLAAIPWPVAHRPLRFHKPYIYGMSDLFKTVRNSSMELNEVYFWTNTVKDWKNLLKPDKFKKLIIETLRKLSEKELIRVYGFVIMPNHIHVIWELLKMNGKEKPHASFNKETSHEIVKDLKVNHSQVLPFFQVNSTDRSYRIWQRDPLAVHIDSIDKLEQKLDYIHLNPLQEKWNLAKFPEDYFWSSASFYENDTTHFDFLYHYKERF